MEVTTSQSETVRGTGVESVFHGLSISSGRIVAEVCLFAATQNKEVLNRTITDEQLLIGEIARLDAAVATCSSQINLIAAEVRDRIGPAEAEIFITQNHIMNDPIIVAEIKQTLLSEKKNLEYVVSKVFKNYERKFDTFNDKYLSERSTDIGEVRRRLLDCLLNTTPGFTCHNAAHCTRGRQRIIVAESLTAQMMMHMDFKHILGLVTEHGGVSSHAAIIARSLGIPAVSGIKGIFDNVSCGMRVLIDGDNGDVYLNPEEKTIRSIIAIEPVTTETICFLSSPAGIEVMANVSHLDDVESAVEARADGIGLFRTEISFIKEGRLLSEDEQFSLYSRVVELCSNQNFKSITFRLLDIGGDKELPFLKLEKEDNPFLGWRGSRFLLGNREIFSAQANALGRVSKLAKIRIMFPMIIDVAQCAQLIALVKECVFSSGGNAENVEFGAMFEVPSACIQAEQIMRIIDFASIGSNDLIQYLFAVDRTNESVSTEYNPEHPVLWEVLNDLSTVARKLGKPLSICGEMAGREGTPSRLIAIGIRTLSVTPRLIPRIRNEVHRTVPK
ncbi:MAG: phosphoenolpyruvate--protein phosphotransferase [Chitinivibrionales bacterium]|nr:phosphoenolpyruvate--protein phosphotransferase [Chitinivibrionales bacterium]